MSTDLEYTMTTKAFNLDGSLEAAEELKSHMVCIGKETRVEFSDGYDGWYVEYDGGWISPGWLAWVRGGSVYKSKISSYGGYLTDNTLPPGNSIPDDTVFPPRYHHSRDRKEKVEFEIGASAAKNLMDALEGNWPVSITTEGNSFKTLYDAVRKVAGS